MYYSDEIIEEVRRRNDIVDVISSHVLIKQRGSNYVGLCPFHSEKTPSFSVSRSKQMFKCFGCGVGGNVFSFVMEYENASFPEAVQILANRAGIELPEADRSDAAKKEQSRRKRMLDINKEAATYYYYQLRKPNGKAGLTYFKERGLTDETLQHFGLGYANVNRDDLVVYLRMKGYKDEEIVESGLGVFDEKYGMGDKFWNRVMFPIQDVNHRVIGFGGRVMGDALPKYLNSPDTPIFDKSRNLYGLGFARSSRKNRMILCEGYMDVISMHQAGFTEAVASLGTAFTEGQAYLLKRYAENVYLAYDSDTAGVKAAMRAIGILRKNGLIGRGIHLTPYKDPDEFIKNLGAEELEKRIEKAESAFDFELRFLEKDYNLSNPDEKERFRKKVIEYIYPLKYFYDDINPYIEAVHQKYLFDLEVLHRSMDKYSYEMQQSGQDVRVMEQTVMNRDENIKPKRPDSPQMRNERVMLTWLCDKPETYPKLKDFLQPEDFTAGVHRAAASLLFEQLKAGREPDPSGIMLALQADEHYDEQEQKEIAVLFSTRIADSYYQSGLRSAEEITEPYKDDAEEIGDVLLAVKEAGMKRFSEEEQSNPDYFGQLKRRREEIDGLRKRIRQDKNKF